MQSMYIISKTLGCQNSRLWQKVFGLTFRLPETLSIFCTYACKVQNCFSVYSCSWTTFIFYVSFNSVIWFWLNFGVILYFLGPNGLFLGIGAKVKSVSGNLKVKPKTFCQRRDFRHPRCFGMIYFAWKPFQGV